VCEDREVGYREREGDASGLESERHQHVTTRRDWKRARPKVGTYEACCEAHLNTALGPALNGESLA